jgi:cytochrome c553
LLPISGEGIPESDHGLRQRDTAIRLVFAGDPGRGIPPCAACHGPAGQKLGAPELEGQHTAYIERQLASFADGSRQNDINEQMRTIAVELTPDEISKVANYYTNTGAIRTGSR